jgi:hypothetical protein
VKSFSKRPSAGSSVDSEDDGLTADDEPQRFGWLSHPRRRNLVWTGSLLLVAVVAFGCWLGFSARDAKSNLEQARNSAQQAKDALLQGNAQDASRHADAAQGHAQAARDAAHSVPWNVASVVPWLGSPFTTGQQITDVVLGLAANVLQPSAQAGATLSPDKLLQGNRVDIQTLRDQEPVLSDLAEAAAQLNAEASAISEPRFMSALGDARTQLQGQTSELADLLENTALAARIAPTMMGADGPRTYFMGFQTNAEARGTGGLLGGFGVLRFDDGTATVDDLGPNTELVGVFKPIDLGPEYEQQYGFTNPFSDVRNSNLSSHFPYTAQIWKSMWAQQSGMNVDGVIAIDPIALSYILGAVGPVTMPDGELVTKDNVVELTESTAYARFPTDQTARKAYLQGIANEIVKKMTGKRVESPRKLLDALGKAVGERRIAVWDSTPAVQEALEQTPLAHSIPEDAAPYAEVVINNLGGNKMDYYLEREIEYAADGCSGDTRMSTITVRLKNAAPTTPLPDYVAGSTGLLPDIPIQVPSGTMVSSVRLLATNGAKLVSAVANNEKVPTFTSVERGHPSFEVQVAIPPGKSGELTFRLSEPTSPGAPRVPIQPLVSSVDPVISVPECPR